MRITERQRAMCRKACERLAAENSLPNAFTVGEIAREARIGETVATIICSNMVMYGEGIPDFGGEIARIGMERADGLLWLRVEPKHTPVLRGVIHHKNGDPKDNTLSNLTRGEPR